MALYVPVAMEALTTVLAHASWVFISNEGGVQPVCWACAEKLELSPEALARVKRFHSMVRREGPVS